ncbi:hypothetical protein AN403_4518 [Pseudomonas fluorescens]|uniref:DUF4124 domain-containing protein n=1 Tax=Pseudomonas fluorescens TaxID=294 RepID=A0A0N8NXI9_PSEFL|nr:DUF4124 domain-containing protein [Pseudomonas fluorescens]KPU60329.1 hypothetical protein AN403_4518 [Pseudomonas fluorescens]
MKFWLLLACFIALSASAQVFTYIDPQGNRVFTDQPKPGNARRVPLTKSNRIAADPTRAAPLIAQSSPEAQVAFHYDALRILVPEPDATIRSNAGEVIVSATNEPGLQPGHRYRLLLDGEPTADPGLSPVFPLSNIDRGSHTLSVEILDEQGRIVERTASQPFHMQRTSLAQKRKIKPCTLDDYGQRPECPLSDKPAEEKNPFLRFF